MLERTEQRFGLKPKLLAADTAYGSGPMLDWLFEQKASVKYTVGRENAGLRAGLKSERF
jgi:hypothetical protein